MGIPGWAARRFGQGEPPVVVRTYGRDSLLVWSNVLLAPIFGLLGLRVGLQSEERIRARIQADTEAMRTRGYLAASTEAFSLPVVGASAAATWYRVMYQRASPEGRGRE